jgi:YHS domain-containing protein
MKHFSIVTLMILAVSAVFFAMSLMPSSGAAESNSSAIDKTAVKGYDVVAYFADGKPTIGKSEFVSTHREQQYQFASAANRDKFVANPEKYAPQYGGYCAFGAARGYKAVIDPTAFAIVDGKLYLNYNASVQSLWEKDIPGFIKLADEKWPKTAKTTKIAR